MDGGPHVVLHLATAPQGTLWGRGPSVFEMSRRGFFKDKVSKYQYK